MEWKQKQSGSFFYQKLWSGPRTPTLICGAHYQKRPLSFRRHLYVSKGKSEYWSKQNRALYKVGNFGGVQ